MSLTYRHCPMLAAKHTWIWAKIAVDEPIILYETSELRTTTTAEGFAHPFGTCLEGFEVVCNILPAVKLAIPAQAQPQSPQTPNLDLPVGPNWTGIWVCGAIRRPIHCFRGLHPSFRDTYKGF